jgi:hypothetical protein
MDTPRLVPLRRIHAPAATSDRAANVTRATYLAGTAADDSTPAPAGAHWGPRRVEPPADDLREMGIDHEAARKAWRSSEYAAGHAHGYADGVRESSRPWWRRWFPAVAGGFLGGALYWAARGWFA